MNKKYKPRFIKSPFGHLKYTVVRNQEQLNKALKGRCELNFIELGGCAEVATIHVENGYSYCFLQIGDTSNWVPNSIMKTLVHESVHIWQAIRQRMYEEAPSVEFEAYSIEDVFSNVLKLYDLSAAK